VLAASSRMRPKGREFVMMGASEADDINNHRTGTKGTSPIIPNPQAANQQAYQEQEPISIPDSRLVMAENFASASRSCSATIYLRSVLAQSAALHDMAIFLPDSAQMTPPGGGQVSFASTTNNRHFLFPAHHDCVTGGMNVEM